MSLFVEPNAETVVFAKKLGADCVELHTGKFSDLTGKKREAEFRLILAAAKEAAKNGLILNAGHGLNYENASRIAGIRGMNELNIGHSIIAYSIFVGIEKAVREMKKLLRQR